MTYTKSDLKKFITKLNSVGILINHQRLLTDFDFASHQIDILKYKPTDAFNNTRIHYGVYEFDMFRLPDRYFEGLTFDSEVPPKNENEEEAIYLDYLGKIEFVENAMRTFKTVKHFNKKGTAQLSPEWFTHDDNDHIYSKHHNPQGLSKSLRKYVTPYNKQFFSCDYSGFQLRILASLSQDTNMVQLCEENDIVTVLWNNLAPYITRDSFKTCMYSFLYGAQRRNLAASAKITINQVDDILLAFTSMFPQAMAYKKSLGKKMNEEIRRIEAQIFNTACIRVDKAGIRVAIPLHDAIVIDSDDEAEAHATIQIMEDTANEVSSGAKFYAALETKKHKQWG